VAGVKNVSAAAPYSRPDLLNHGITAPSIVRDISRGPTAADLALAQTPLPTPTTHLTRSPSQTHDRDAASLDRRQPGHEVQFPPSTSSRPAFSAEQLRGSFSPRTVMSTLL